MGAGNAPIPAGRATPGAGHILAPTPFHAANALTLGTLNLSINYRLALGNR